MYDTLEIVHSATCWTFLQDMPSYTHNGYTGYKETTSKAQQARSYVTWKKEQVDVWLQSLRNGKEPPTAEQDRFLQRVVQRCKEERAELAPSDGQKKKKLSEPVRDCLFGIPGAGKSTCIKHLRQFFEQCLGWEDGVQFQFLASQNTMAALIGGTTVHGWGTIPVNATVAADKASSKNQDGDIDQLFLNALGIMLLPKHAPGISLGCLGC